jgi:glutamine synthetase
MALGALVNAGVDGVRRKLALPPVAEKSFWAMSEAERAEQGARELPHSHSPRRRKRRTGSARNSSMPT